MWLCGFVWALSGSKVQPWESKELELTDEGHTQEFALYPMNDGEVLKGGNGLTMS